MAWVMFEQDKYDEALQTYNEIYEKQKHILGVNHPDTLTTLHNVALVMDKQGKYDEALKRFEEVLENRKLQLGEEHLDTLATKEKIEHMRNKSRCGISWH
jgi:tetratricopeptide (TPR) repeat protein